MEQGGPASLATLMLSPVGDNHEDHEEPFGLHEGDYVIKTQVYGHSLIANAPGPRNEGREHSQLAFKVAHLAAGGRFCLLKESIFE